ncbi:MAG: class I adenylate-forming enzyme family protein, partial [Caulobacteraceae bacterium]
MTLPPNWPAMSLAKAHELLTQPGSPFEMDEVVVRGIPTRTWKHAPPTLRDLFLMARGHGQKTFMVFENERVTYDAFVRATLNLAQALTNQGVQKGDRVAVIYANVPEWPVSFFASLLVGAIATPLNAWWTGGELEYALKDSGAKIILCDFGRYERIKAILPRLPDLKRVYVSRAKDDVSRDGAARLEDIIGPSSAWGRLPEKPLPAVEIAPDDDATIFYTSGTTGHPKGALGTHRNGVAPTFIAGLSAPRAMLRRGEVPPPPDPNAPQRKALLSIPFFHVTGCFALLCPTIYQGGLIAMMRKWDAEEAMQIIEREKITIAGGVPTIAWQLLEHPARAKYDLSSLETVTYGGAPAAPELVRKIKQIFPKSEPSTGWGMTETSATFTHHAGEDYQNRPDSCGPAPPVCELKVVDKDGRTLPVGEIGELMGKGPNVLHAYWNKPEATRETFIDGWVR